MIRAPKNLKSVLLESAFTLALTLISCLLAVGYYARGQQSEIDLLSQRVSQGELSKRDIITKLDQTRDLLLELSARQEILHRGRPWGRP